MWVRSSFLQDLRERWVQPPGDRRVGRLIVVAADRDEFVGDHTSQAPFEEEIRAVVHGDHLSMVKPQHPDHPSVVLVVRALAGANHLTGAVSAALAAIELNTFRRHVHDWLGHADDLDKNAIVTLALSLEELGEHDQALQVLETYAQKHTDTDVTGTYAGRLKRRWQVGRRDEDGQQALKFYRDALDAAEAKQDPAQGFYHAINTAFLLLAYKRDHDKARAMAKRALQHCAAVLETKDAYWRIATQAEAHLILSELNPALADYRRALALQKANPAEDSQRQIASTYAQACAIADALGDGSLKARLRALFESEDG